MRRTAAGLVFSLVCGLLLAQDHIDVLPGVTWSVEIDGLNGANISSITIDDLSIDSREAGAARPGLAYLSDSTGRLHPWLIEAQEGHKVLRDVRLRVVWPKSESSRGWNLLRCAPLRWMKDEKTEGGTLVVAVHAVEFAGCGERFDPIALKPIPFESLPPPKLPDDDEEPPNGPTGGSTTGGGGTGGASPPTNYPYGPESFESAPYGNVGASGSQTQNGNGWGVGTPRGGAFKGDYAAGIGFAGSYPSASREFMFTPEIDLSQAKNPVLTFQHRYDIESGYDYARVLVYLPQTDQWDTVQPEGGYPIQNLVYNVPGTGFYSGSQTAWTPAMFDLSKYAGVSRVVVVFEFGSDDSIEYEGWYIDLVEVAEGSAPSGAPPSGTGGSTPPGAGTKSRVFDLTEDVSHRLSSLKALGCEIQGVTKGRVAGYRVEWVHCDGEEHRDSWSSMRIHYEPGKRAITEISLQGPIANDRSRLECWLQRAEEGRRVCLKICIVEILTDGSDGRRICFPQDLRLSAYQYPVMSADGTGSLTESVTLKPERLSPQ